MTLELQDYERIIEIMAYQSRAKYVIKNYYYNDPWWPVHIKDWRIRMIIAGLGTRISSSMIGGAYTKIINEIDKIGFDKLNKKSDSEIIKLIKPLGLSKNRLKFIRSMSTFVNKIKNINDYCNNELIRLISKNVKGAGYKVGACCVLYAKGYECGIIPVDSGIKDILAPCLQLETSKTSIGHEQVRKQLEELSKKCSCRKIYNKTGYSYLNLSNDTPISWWLHLVMISFKRQFCNKRNPNNCPLAQDDIVRKKICCACLIKK